ncbi:MAG: hypothetical protein J7M30_03415 [Deltaproteobacteria bacterium]|nr:hypothetical protein [Deltaproteobacteria bacterium]
MADSNCIFENLLCVQKPTDMQIALYILRLMDDGSHGFQSCKDQGFGRGYIVKLAEKALESMTNPCAKKLLMDEIKKP